MCLPLPLSAALPSFPFLPLCPPHPYEASALTPFTQWSVVKCVKHPSVAFVFFSVSVSRFHTHTFLVFAPVLLASSKSCNMLSPGKKVVIQAQPQITYVILICALDFYTIFIHVFVKSSNNITPV